MNHLATYQERIDRFSATAAALQKKYNRFSFIRLLSFFAAIAALIPAFSLHPLVGIFLAVVFIMAFYRLVQWHQKLLGLKQVEEALVRINQQEQSFMNDDFTVFSDGAVFANSAHPYSIDMDLFGPYSFFQYTNRTVTSLGQQRLADFLSDVTEPAIIRSRQAAVKELKDQLDWRQQFQAYGMTTEDAPEHLVHLRSWLNEPPFISNHPWYKTALYVFPLISLLGAFLWALYLPWFIGILFFIPAGYLIKTTLHQVNKTHVQTEKAGDILAYYAKLIRHIEKKDFTSPKLQTLKKAFATMDQNASDQLQRLSYIIHQLNVRNNPFVLILNLMGLWDLQWVFRLEQWKDQQKEDLLRWFDALAEMEALISFATIAYNRPNWIFPTLTDQPILQAQQLGHPLIAPSQRIANDITIPTAGHLKLVTGSNMAGKSTFLRTVGLNIVLAMAGAPVCAKQFSLPILKLYTSMRTQDALHESTSSFYAELKRLKIIIEAVDEQDNVFFLMDEILKGTNSRDRHTGSKALIDQLIKGKGAGIIATHDLELGSMAEAANGTIENLCIEVEVKGDQLFFDYKIKPGVSKSFNATLLMREMGIKV